MGRMLEQTEILVKTLLVDVGINDFKDIKM